MPAHLIAEEGPQRGQTFDLSENGDFVVGRDPDQADLVLEDSSVSRRHVRFTKTDEGVQVKNLSRTNPAKLNEQPLSGVHLLKEGDKIEIGSSLFLFSEEEIPALAAPKEPKSAYDTLFEDIPEEETPSSSKSAYDTIFEEGREEAEIPFHLLAETPYILKVVSGPNAGAEIGIEKGRSYVLGKDPNASDITFQDMSVSRTHARLTVEEDGAIYIEDLSSKNGTYLNSEEVREKTKLQSFDLISLGTTGFYVLDQNAPQETIYSPMSAEESEEESLEEKPAEEPFAEKQEAPAIDWRRQPIPRRYLVIGGSAAAVFLIVFLSFFSLFKTSHLEMAKAQPEKEIESILSKYPDVRFSFNPASGRLFLVGHVLSGADYTEMTYSLDQVQGLFSLENTVVIDELVSKEINDVLSANASWAGVTIRSPKAGLFAATGYLPTQAESAELADYLALHFPYLDRLQYRVVTEDTLKTQIDGIVLSKSLGGVSFQLSNGDVVLSGRYDERRKAEMEALIRELSVLAGVARVQNFAVPSDPNQAAFDLSDQFVIGGEARKGENGYSVVLNGKLYTLGQRVEGMKIIQIDPALILLEKDGLKYKIEYTH